MQMESTFGWLGGGTNVWTPQKTTGECSKTHNWRLVYYHDPENPETERQLSVLVESVDPPTVRELLTMDAAKPFANRELERNVCLHGPVRSRDASLVRKMLEDHPQKRKKMLRQRDGEGRNPLHVAADMGEFESVSVMLGFAEDSREHDKQMKSSSKDVNDSCSLFSARCWTNTNNSPARSIKQNAKSPFLDTASKHNSNLDQNCMSSPSKDVNCSLSSGVEQDSDSDSLFLRKTSKEDRSHDQKQKPSSHLEAVNSSSSSDMVQDTKSLCLSKNSKEGASSDQRGELLFSKTLLSASSAFFRKQDCGRLCLGKNSKQHASPDQKDEPFPSETLDSSLASDSNLEQDVEKLCLHENSEQDISPAWNFQASMTRKAGTAEPDQHGTHPVWDSQAPGTNPDWNSQTSTHRNSKTESNHLNTSGGVSRNSRGTGEGGRRKDISKKLVNVPTMGDGYTALHFAAKNCNAEVVQLLLLRGANVNARNIENNTPLHLLCMAEEPCCQRRLEAARLLLEAGADCNLGGTVRISRLHTLKRMTPTMMAAFRNHVDLLQLLSQYGADFSAKGEDGMTPLTLALAVNCEDAALYLLTAHPGMANSWREQSDNSGRTPMHYVSHCKEKAGLLVSMLLKQGFSYAVPNAVKGQGCSDMHLTFPCSRHFSCWRRVYGQSPLCYAVCHEKVDVIQAIFQYDPSVLLRSQVGLFPMDSPLQALVSVESPDFVEMAKLLLTHGADPSTVTSGTGTQEWSDECEKSQVADYVAKFKGHQTSPEEFCNVSLKNLAMEVVRQCIRRHLHNFKEDIATLPVPKRVIDELSYANLE